MNQENYVPITRGASTRTTVVEDQTLSAVFAAEDEAEAPALPDSIVQSGWRNARERRAQAKSRDFGSYIRLTNEPILVAFVQGEPFATYRQHWLERDGRRSFVCLGAECPLCLQLGDKPRERYDFNVVNYMATDESGNSTPRVEILSAGPRLLDILSDVDENKIKGPLAKRKYYAINSTGSGAQTNYVVDFIRPDEMEEAFDMDVTSAALYLEQAVPYDTSVLRVDTVEELATLASEMLRG